MNGKIRDGSMLRIPPFPKTYRNTTARLPVQKAIGRPSINSRPSEPNRRIVSQPMPISRPTSGSLPHDDHHILRELGEALKHHERRTHRNSELDRPILDAPLGERVLADLHG